MRSSHLAAATAAVLAFLAAPARAQDDPAVSDLQAAGDALVQSQPDLVVTATRTVRDPFDLPQSVRVFDREEIDDSGSFVVFQSISRRDAGIWYDERTSTTTDPIIRGFAGFNLLTLVDGNTLTTLWGEGGFGADDMYGKIDPDTVERIEVIRGPNSALYGSNALGAVINVITRASPLDFTDAGFAWGRRVKFEHATAAEASAGRAEVYGASPHFRFLLGGSLREFDDVVGGGGLRELVPSEGRERNWDFSGEYLLNDRQSLRLTVQDVHRADIKRYYRPTQNNTNDREAFALFFTDRGSSDYWDELEARIYRQEKIDEREFLDTGKTGRATTTTWQGGLRATRDMGGGHVVTAGLQLEMTDGDSPDDEQFTIISPLPRRRDAPLSDWRDIGIYVQDEWRACEAVGLTSSVRYDRQVFETRVDPAYVPAIGNPQDDEIRDSVGSVTGGLGAVFYASDELHYTASYARGFRQNAPNFGLRQLGDGVLIPNELLDPTTSDNFEIGVKTRSRAVRFDGSVYYSMIDNWQGDLRPTMFNGRSFLDFNANGARDANEGFVKQVEGGDAYVAGIELNATVYPSQVWSEVPENWSVWGSFAHNRGRVDATDANPHTEPLRHTQPTRAILGVRWDDVEHPSQRLHVEGVVDMVDRYDAIPSDRRDGDLAWRRDAQDGTSPHLRSYIGTPGYTLFHIYSGVNLDENLRIRVGVENVTNKKYRAAHSRSDAPGRNLKVAVEWDF